MDSQASRSSAIWTISSQNLVLRGVQGQVVQAGGPGSPDPVLSAGPQPVTELELGDGTVRSGGREAHDPHAVRVGDPQLSPGVRRFLADDQPYPLRPAVQQIAGEFGDQALSRTLRSASTAGVQAGAGIFSTCR